MTIAKQDPEAWRKRVDKKLNSLTKGHQELKERMDRYEHTINNKLDILIEVHNRIKFGKKILTFLGRTAQTMLSTVANVGFALVTLGTAYWVLKDNNGWWESVQAFITTYTGNSHPK